jgi:hypothetical protein
LTGADAGRTDEGETPPVRLLGAVAPVFVRAPLGDDPPVVAVLPPDGGELPPVAAEAVAANASVTRRIAATSVEFRSWRPSLMDLGIGPRRAFA